MVSFKPNLKLGSKSASKPAADASADQAKPKETKEAKAEEAKEKEAKEKEAKEKAAKEKEAKEKEAKEKAAKEKAAKEKAAKEKAAKERKATDPAPAEANAAEGADADTKDRQAESSKPKFSWPKFTLPSLPKSNLTAPNLSAPNLPKPSLAKSKLGLAKLKGAWAEPMVRNDGKDRSHMPALPAWVKYVRLLQLCVAIIMAGLTSSAATQLGSQVDGFGMTWFAFIWTLFYFIWIVATIFSKPELYHVFAQVPLELMTNAFWLATWAVLARDATIITEFENDFGGFRIGRLPGAYRRGLQCVKAAAGVGAFEWILFCATLIYLANTVLRSRVKTTSPEEGTSTEMRSR